MGYLEEFWDPSTTVSPDDTQLSIALEEIDRLQTLDAVCRCASEMKRRLGSDAEREELARDKRLARRLCHVFAKSLAAWTGSAIEITQDHRSKAAVLDWPALTEEIKADLIVRRRYIASWGKLTDNERIAKTYVVRISNELRDIDYALR